VHKAHALKWFFHLFYTYGINRRAWYLLIIRLSFVSPNCPEYSTSQIAFQPTYHFGFPVLIYNNVNNKQ